MPACGGRPVGGAGPVPLAGSISSAWGVPVGPTTSASAATPHSVMRCCDQPVCTAAGALPPARATALTSCAHSAACRSLRPARTRAKLSSIRPMPMRPRPCGRHQPNALPSSARAAITASACCGCRVRRCRGGSGAASAGAAAASMAPGDASERGAATAAPVLPPVTARPSSPSAARAAASRGPSVRTSTPRPRPIAARTPWRCALPRATRRRWSMTSRSSTSRLAASSAAPSPSCTPGPTAIWLRTCMPASLAQRRRYFSSGCGAPASNSTRADGTAAISTGTRPRSAPAPSRRRSANSTCPGARAWPRSCTWPAASVAAVSATCPAGSSSSTRAPGRPCTRALMAMRSPGAAGGGVETATRPVGTGASASRTGIRSPSRSRAGRPLPCTTSAVVPGARRNAVARSGTRATPGKAGASGRATHGAAVGRTWSAWVPAVATCSSLVLPARGGGSSTG